MSVPQIQIDLQLPPAERWNALHPFLDEGRQLLAQYATDLGGIAQFHDMIRTYRDTCIDATPEEVLVVNLY